MYGLIPSKKSFRFASAEIAEFEELQLSPESNDFMQRHGGITSPIPILSNNPTSFTSSSFQTLTDYF